MNYNTYQMVSLATSKKGLAGMGTVPHGLEVNCPTFPDFNETHGVLTMACYGALAEHFTEGGEGHAAVLEDWQIKKLMNGPQIYLIFDLLKRDMN